MFASHYILSALWVLDVVHFVTLKEKIVKTWGAPMSYMFTLNSDLNLFNSI